MSVLSKFPQFCKQFLTACLVVLQLAPLGEARTNNTAHSSARLAAKGKGGIAGGGGTICASPTINGGQPILLDLTLGPVRGGPDNLGRLYLPDSERGDIIDLNDPANYIGKRRFPMEELATYQIAKEIIKFWSLGEKDNPLVRLLISSLESIVFIGVTCDLGKPEKYSVAGNAYCSEKDLRQVIYYQQGMAFFSIPSFNSLGRNSKISLWLHEAVRNLQIQFNIQISDLDLQNFVQNMFVGYLLWKDLSSSELTRQAREKMFEPLQHKMQNHSPDQLFAQSVLIGPTIEMILYSRGENIVRKMCTLRAQSEK